MFEMAAGYELTQTRPLESDYKDIDKKVRVVLEFIFEKGFPHDITEVGCSSLSVFYITTIDIT